MQIYLQRIFILSHRRQKGRIVRTEPNVTPDLRMSYVIAASCNKYREHNALTHTAHLSPLLYRRPMHKGLRTIAIRARHLTMKKQLERPDSRRFHLLRMAP